MYKRQSHDARAFVEASRAAVKRARMRRGSLALGGLIVLLTLACAGWAVSHARHRAAVALAISHAREIDEKAEETGRAADRARGEALAFFEKDDLAPAEDRWKQMLALEEALQRLGKMDARQARIVELRFFGGLTEEEAADVLGVSSRTVKRDWKMAKAWLFSEMNS